MVPCDSVFIDSPNVTLGAERFGIRQEELLQRLRISASKHTAGIGNLVVLLIFPVVLPKMGQMIERVRIDSLFHLPATRADFLRRLGRRPEAAAAYAEALELASTRRRAPLPAPQAGGNGRPGLKVRGPPI